MLFTLYSLGVWGALLSISHAASLHSHSLHGRASTRAAVVLPPSQDPFYTIPAGYQTAAPGAILRVRQAPGNLTSIIQNCSIAYNILYRTTDSLYQPSWAVTTLLSPLSSSNSTSLTSNGTSPGGALLSYQIPYDSAFLDSSPSFALYNGGEPDIPTALGRGWYVNVPDYEGPLASFTAGVQSGHATLDSVRAVLSLGFGLSPNAKYALWGYSGGALASEWAAELQIQYAPELKFNGAAIGGLTPNVSSVLESVNGGLEAGLIPAGILGLASQYPALYSLVDQQLKPSGQFNKTGFWAAKNMSLDQSIETYAEQNIYDYFINGSSLLQTASVMQILNSDGLMGYHGVPQMPLFVYKAISDEVSKVADTDALVNRYCSVGASILYQRNTVGGHDAEETNGEARAFEWLSSALDGTLQQPSGCTIQNITVNITSIPF